MSRYSKKKQGQQRVLEEIRKQLVLQAERWGRNDYYTPQKLEEMVVDQCFRIKGDFLSEKANLEYEMQRIDTDKKDCLIKLEKISNYLRKSEHVISIHKKAVARWLERMLGDQNKLHAALDKRVAKPKVSVLIGEN